MKKTIKKYFPTLFLRAKKVKENYRTTKSIKKDYLHDFNKYLKLSSSLGLSTKENHQSFLIREYHAVEKGLALPNPRPGFGQTRILELVESLNDYIVRYGSDLVTDVSIEAIQEYVDYDKKFNTTKNEIIGKLEDFIKSYQHSNSEGKGGTLDLTRKEVLEAIDFDFSKFISARHSVRHFSPEPVDSKIILDAIGDAIYTPSVCNRQAWKAYVVDHTNTELKAKFLNVQNGNKGFGDQISSLVIVTGKLSSFFSFERNQVFIDGGMFAMSLILALHAKGLGTCCLNNSYTAEREAEYMKVMKMDEDTVPIMFIAVGNLKDTFKIASSARKSIDDIAVVC